MVVSAAGGRLERREPLWGLLTCHWQVTAMDRRGRGSSGDAEPYELSHEYEDVAAATASLADRDGRPPDVFGHSTARSARWAPRRAAPRAGASPCTSRPGRRRPRASGGSGPAPSSRRDGPGTFQTEVTGLSRTQIDELRNTPGAQDALPIVSGHDAP